VSTARQPIHDLSLRPSRRTKDLRRRAACSFINVFTVPTQAQPAQVDPRLEQAILEKARIRVLNPLSRETSIVEVGKIAGAVETQVIRSA
jgi:hypothetical protein